MWHLLRSWKRRRILAGADLSHRVWRPVWDRLPVLAGLDAVEARRVRELAVLFMHEKSLEPVAGFTLVDGMVRELALLACLPVLNLGLDWFDEWMSVVLYPGAFVSDFEMRDDAGVVHRVREARAGESWERGPMVIGWADVRAGHRLDGYNVIIHEVAHKLDALDGAVNGRPPLHREMSADRWRRVFSAAFDDLQLRTEAGEETAIDPYAGESPGEFFAVVSEAFFEVPHHLERAYPEVYRQLRAFYRQDPKLRLPDSRW